MVSFVNITWQFKFEVELTFEVHCLQLYTIHCIITYYNSLVMDMMLCESFHFMVDVFCYSLVTSTTLVMTNVIY